MYTASDVRKELVRKHGSKVDFLLKWFDRLGFVFGVGDLRGRTHGADTNGVLVGPGANSLDEAAKWALDGLRVWAGKQRTDKFRSITRLWAKWGEGAQDVPACLGSTIDWLYLFSRDASSDPAPLVMYPVYSRTASQEWDLFNIYMWVFCNKPSTFELKGADYAVDLSSDRGLHKDFWECAYGIPTTEDQTHHFAGYFYWGAHVGYGSIRRRIALAGSGDWGPVSGVLNRGDAALGDVAASWGAYMREKPAYIGRRVATSLRLGLAKNKSQRTSVYERICEARLRRVQRPAVKKWGTVVVLGDVRIWRR